MFRRGCPNLAAYDVLRYDFDLGEGALVFEPDQSCPTICAEHAIDNERQAEGERRPGAVVRYPHTNRGRRPGFTVYRQLEPQYGREAGP